MTFDDIIGQEEVKGHLRRLLQENKLPHAIMFCGPKGAGKLPLALAYAQMLLCQNPTEEGACGKCSDCQMSSLWTHPDLHFSFPIYKGKSSDNPRTSTSRIGSRTSAPRTSRLSSMCRRATTSRGSWHSKQVRADARSSSFGCRNA